MLAFKFNQLFSLYFHYAARLTPLIFLSIESMTALLEYMFSCCFIALLTVCIREYQSVFREFSSKNLLIVSQHSTKSNYKTLDTVSNFLIVRMVDYSGSMITIEECTVYFRDVVVLCIRVASMNMNM